MPPIRPAALSALIVLALFPGVASAALRADTDHDKIFETLSLNGSAPRPVLVALRQPATAARVGAIESDVGDLGHTTRLRLVDAFAADATPEQIRELSARADVDHVEDDAVAVPFGTAAQAALGVTRARQDVPALDGHGLVAAVIDSGVDTTMPDLPGAKLIAFKDLVNGRTDPYDDLGHGSMVADILAGTGASGAEGRGVAPGASLVSVKVIDANAQSSLGLIAQGIQWAVENRAKYGIDVLNLSIGDPTGCGDGTDVASKAVDAAVAAGIVVVVAAGNAGPAKCSIKSPAAAESAVTVGAMADPGTGGFSEAWFSSRGPTADGRIKPDVMAPGVNVPIAPPGGGTFLFSGTSAAAPFVAGTALLMLQANPALSPAAVKEEMERTATDWGVAGRDNDYGSGRLDAYAALQAAGAALATPPGLPAHRSWSGTLAQGTSTAFDIDVADSRYPLAVTLNAASSGFGLALRDASGTGVGTMTPQPVASRQGDTSLTVPAPGRYTVTVSAVSDSGPWVLDVSGGIAPADTVAPALTVDQLTPARAAGAAGTALGDFPGVVVRVSEGDDLVRRIGVTPILGRWSADLALPDGTYSVTAEQGDGSGNITRTPAQTLTIDTVAPTTALESGPGDVVRTPTVTFGFTASEPGATLECRLGAVAAYAACSSPFVAGPLADGTYTLFVRATDAAGNVGAPATRTFTVDTKPDPTPTPTPTPTAEPSPTPVPFVAMPTPTLAPMITLKLAKQRLTTVRKKGLAVQVTCSCRVALSLAAGKTVLTRRTVAAGRVTLTLPATARRALKRTHRVTLTLTAAAAGAKTVTTRVTLSG